MKRGLQYEQLCSSLAGSKPILIKENWWQLRFHRIIANPPALWTESPRSPLLSSPPKDKDVGRSENLEAPVVLWWGRICPPDWERVNCSTQILVGGGGGVRDPPAHLVSDIPERWHVPHYYYYTVESQIKSCFFPTILISVHSYSCIRLEKQVAWVWK